MKRLMRLMGVAAVCALALCGCNKETGKTFCYWMDTDTGQAAVFPEKAEEDKEYVAVFETNQP